MEIKDLCDFDSYDDSIAYLEEITSKQPEDELDLVPMMNFALILLLKCVILEELDHKSEAEALTGHHLKKRCLGVIETIREYERAFKIN